MKIAGLNGDIKANIGVASSYYSKNALGKFTDKNMLDTILKDRPQQYDKIIKLFTQTRLKPTDFTDTLMAGSTPFYVDEPDGQWEYKMHKYTELPKIMVNLSDTIARPGIDGQTFDLVFDKKVFVTNDIIMCERMNQEVHLQVVDEPVAYQNFFKYTFRAIGSYSDSYVSQRFLVVGTEYYKVINRIGEYTTDFTTLGLIDGNISVTTEGLIEYGIEHTMTDYARMKQITNDKFGNPLDLTYYSITGKTDMGNPINLTVWEPTIARLMRMEMERMKANYLLWGRAGKAADEKGRPMKVYSGLWQQMNNNGNIVYYNKGRFSMNIFRYTLDNLFTGRVSYKDRKAIVYTNTAGLFLVDKAIKEDALGQGFTFNAENYVKGKDRVSLGFQFGFTNYHSRETGDIEFVVLDQLDESVTFLEQGNGKRKAPIFIIMDVSGGSNQGVRELKLKSRPNGLSASINGITGFNGVSDVQAVSKDPWKTWVMKDFTGLFLEDATKTVIIKEYPQFG